MPGNSLSGLMHADALVLRCPGMTAVVRAPDADGGDAAPDSIGPLRMRQNRVRAEPACAGKPRSSRGMVVQSGHRTPALAIVVAGEEPRLVHARVVAIVAAADGPDLIQLAIAAVGIGRALVDLTPGLQVGARRAGPLRRPGWLSPRKYRPLGLRRDAVTFQPLKSGTLDLPPLPVLSSERHRNAPFSVPTITITPMRSPPSVYSHERRVCLTPFFGFFGPQIGGEAGHFGLELFGRPAGHGNLLPDEGGELAARNPELVAVRSLPAEMLLQDLVRPGTGGFSRRNARSTRVQRPESIEAGGRRGRIQVVASGISR